MDAENTDLMIEAETLRKFLLAFSPGTDVIKLRVGGEQGLLATQTDMRNVSICSATLHKDYLPKVPDECLEIGLDVDAALKALKPFRSKYSQLVTFSPDFEGEVYSLTGWRAGFPDGIMSQVRTEGHRIERADLIRTIKPPELEFRAELSLPAVVFQDAVKVVGGGIEIQIATTELHLVFSNEEISYRMPLECLSTGDVGPTCSRYSAKYLENIAKRAPKNSSVGLGLRSDYPVRIEFNLIGPGSQVIYTLAPRIHQE